jgi:hypothetical protein
LLEEVGNNLVLMMNASSDFEVMVIGASCGSLFIDEISMSSLIRDALSVKLPSSVDIHGLRVGVEHSEPLPRFPPLPVL